MSRMRRLAGLLRHPVVRLMAAAAILAAVLAAVDRASLWVLLTRLDPWVAAVMFAVNLVILVLSANRWRWFAATAGFVAPWQVFFRATWLAWAAAECGPALLTAETARFFGMRCYGPPLILALSQFGDRLSGFFGLILLDLLCLPRQVQRVNSALSGAGTALAGAAIVVAVIAGSLSLRRFGLAFGNRRGAFAAAAQWLKAPSHYALSLSINALFAVNLTLAARALGMRVDVFDLFCLAPLILLGVASLPSLVSDWGKREAVAVVLLAPLGLEAEQSVALSLVYGGVHSLSALPGLFYLLRQPRTQNEV